MEFIVVKNFEEMSQVAAAQIAHTIQEHTASVLGLATGSTPIGMYKELVRKYMDGEIDFSQVRTFNLDEYVGLSASHPQSYHVYMQNHLFNHVNASPENVYIPKGDALDLQLESKQYDEAINQAGGIDLQILGLGVNGHIGFNEPGSDPAGKTRVVQLAESTIQANSRFFERIENVPQQAITVGIGTILNQSKRIMLLVSGEEKAQAIKNMVDQEPNIENPASYLKLHKHITIIVDKSAAKLIHPSRLLVFKQITN